MARDFSFYSYNNGYGDDKKDKELPYSIITQPENYRPNDVKLFFHSERPKVKKYWVIRQAVKNVSPVTRIEPIPTLLMKNGGIMLEIVLIY